MHTQSGVLVALVACDVLSCHTCCAQPPVAHDGGMGGARHDEPTASVTAPAAVKRRVPKKKKKHTRVVMPRLLPASEIDLSVGSCVSCVNVSVKHLTKCESHYLSGGDRTHRSTQALAGQRSW